MMTVYSQANELINIIKTSDSNSVVLNVVDIIDRFHDLRDLAGCSIIAKHAIVSGLFESARLAEQKIFNDLVDSLIFRSKMGQIGFFDEWVTSDITELVQKFILVQDPNLFKGNFIVCSESKFFYIPSDFIDSNEVCLIPFSYGNGFIYCSNDLDKAMLFKLRYC